MRNLIIGAAALLAMAASSVASAETGGAIKLTFASIDSDDNSSYFCECFNDSKDNVAALSGVVVTDLSHDGWRLQFNATSADLEHSSHSDAYSQVEVHAVKHLGEIDVGVFAGMFNNGGSNFNELGIEAAMNFEGGQIAVSAATADSPNASYYDETTTVAATGTFNLNDNWSIGGTISSTDFGNFGDGEDIESFGVNVAYHVPNTRLTVGVGYRSSEGEQEVEFLGVSLSWGFGEGALGREMPGALALIPDAITAE
jgi:hypothetical protein